MILLWSRYLNVQEPPKLNKINSKSLHVKFIYDCDNSKRVFIHRFYRVTQTRACAWENVQIMLVGNKCDLEEERVISTDRGRQLADQLSE